MARFFRRKNISMNIQPINNGEKGSSVRAKINALITGVNNQFVPLVLNKTNNTFVLDFSGVNNAVIDLNSDIPDTTYLSITNMNSGGGRILVLQAGGKKLIPDSSFIQEVTIPIQKNKACMINYAWIDEKIYMYSTDIVSDVYYQGADAIDSLSIDSFDGATLTMKWVEPAANAPDGSMQIDGYDIRYSHSPIAKTDNSGWLNAKSFTNLPTPHGANTEVSFEVRNMLQGVSYYIYVKTYKIYKGVYYLSQLSNGITVKTKSYTDIGGDPKQLPISEQTTFLKQYKFQADQTDGSISLPKYLYDKSYKHTSLTNDTPDVTDKTYPSAWATFMHAKQYEQRDVPYYMVFELPQKVKMTSIYFAVKEALTNTSIINVYVAKDEYSDWEYLTQISIAYGTYWGQVVLKNFVNTNEYKLVKLAQENYYYGEKESVNDGEECIQSAKLTVDIKKIYFFGIFGNPMNEEPLNILQPLKDYSEHLPMGEVMQVNGNFFQQGRIFSLIGGSTPRLFGSFGYFDPNGFAYNYKRYTTIKGYKFLTNLISWIKDNNGDETITGLYLLLKNTYKPYGLKPFLTASSNMDCVRMKEPYTYNGTATYKIYTQSKYIDQNLTKIDTPPKPVKGIAGWKSLFDLTFDPKNYTLMAMFAAVMAARYGTNKNIQSTDVAIESTIDGENIGWGLDLLSGLEYGNEDNADYDSQVTNYNLGGLVYYCNGWLRFQQPEEFAAYYAAIYDGFKKQIAVNGYDSAFIGSKNIDKDFLVIGSGTAGIESAYLYHAILKAKQLRKDNIVPFDVLNVHSYSSTAGDFQQTGVTGVYAIPYDTSESQAFQLSELLKIRNRYAQDKPIWITEFGFGECEGVLDTADNVIGANASKYQCSSMKGYVQNGHNIPDRHASEVKAAWAVRAIMDFNFKGVNKMFYYTAFNEENWFSQGTYGQCGYDMFDWDAITDDTPGARYNVIKNIRTTATRGGFAGMGLFGSSLVNGGYPIARGTWMWMTFHNRLKDYIQVGQKTLTKYPNIVIACFKHKDTAKGAFVIWKKCDDNSCYIDVELDVGSAITSVTHIKQYIPKLPDPRKVPYAIDFGVSAKRDGLATSTRTYDENGKVISATLPSKEENPYFPIVSTVGTVVKFTTPNNTVYNQVMGANQYYEPTTQEIKYGGDGYLRQIEAIADYIQFHPEGIKGANGIEEPQTLSGSTLTIDIVSGFPELYMTDKVLDSDFNSTINNLTAKAQGTSQVDLYFNNTNPNDYSYDVYMSSEINGNYLLKQNTLAAVKNKITISGLTQNTTYYFKLQAKRVDGALGVLTDYVVVTTNKQYDAIVLSASNVSTDTLTLNWKSPITDDNSNSFESYEIIKTDYLGNDTTIKITDKTATTYSETALESGKSYNYKIRYYMYDGVSDYSSILTVRTKTPAEVAPVISNVAYPATTTDNPITATITYTGLASEYSLDGGTSWLTLPTTNKISITLANSSGEQTFNLVLRNSTSQSASWEIKVTYTPPAFDLASIVIDNGATQTNDFELSIKMNVVGIQTPAYYRISSSETGLASAEYIAWNSNTIVFTSPTVATNSTITLYCQVKTADATQSSVKSSSILYVEPAKQTAYIKDIGYSGSEQYGQRTDIITGKTVSVVMAGNTATGNVVPSGKTRKTFYDTDGNVMGTLESIPDTLTITNDDGTAITKYSQAYKATYISGAFYPELFFSNCMGGKQLTASATTPTYGGYQIAGLEAGTYSLYIWDISNNAAQKSTGKYNVNGIEYDCILGARNANIGSSADNIEPEYKKISVTIAQGAVINISTYIRGSYDSSYTMPPRIAMIKLVKES